MQSVGPYASLLPFALVSVGIGLTSLGTILLYYLADRPGSRRTLLLSLFVISWTLLSIRSVRFDVLSGTDNLSEYRNSLDVQEAAAWFVEGQEQTRYVFSLIISIHPVAWSELAGADLAIVFRYFNPIVEAIIPIILFILVEKIIGDRRVAFLSSLLYAESITFFLQSAELTRLQFGLLFFLLVIFLSFMRSKAAAVALVPLLLGLVTSHYAMIYFAFPALLGIALQPSLVKLLPRAIAGRLRVDKIRAAAERGFLSVPSFLLYLLLSLTWLTYVASWLFARDLVKAVTVLMETIGLLPGIYSISNVYALSSPLGLASTLWVDVITVICLIGILYVWFLKRKTSAMTAYYLAGTLFTLLLAAWYFLPYLSITASVARVYGITFILISTFGGVLLADADRRTNLTLGSLVLGLNLAMNLVLFSPTSTVIMYKPQYAIDPESSAAEIYSTTPGLSAAKWITDNLPASAVVSSDLRGLQELYYVPGDRFRLVSNATFRFDSDYLLVHYFFLRYRLWALYERGVGRHTKTIDSSESPLLVNNLVYSSGYMAIVKRAKSLRI